MKTNKILGTLALAALAAACSNEEFEAVNNSPALNGRVELGQISLTVAGADTRWDIGANFNDLVPVVGDALGACLVDAPNAVGNTKDAKYNYNLTDYISTNYAFKFDGSKYVSEAKMVEGNYVFYAPYNANHATRTPIVAKLNPIQQLNAAEDGSIDALSTIKQLNNSGEVVLVGHKFISEADGKQVSAVLKPIYAYPLITLKNDYKPENANGVKVPTDLVINQIVIENGSTFTIEAPLKFKDATAQTAITASEGVVNKLRDFTYWEDQDHPSTAVKGAWIKGKGNSANYTADIMGDAEDESSAIIVKAPANAWTLKAGQSTEFYAVVPASASAITKISVYTNKGVFVKDNDAITTADADNVKIGVGRRYPIGEYDGNGNLIVPNEGGAAKPGDAYTCTLSDPNGDGAMIVASSTDLAALITSAKVDDELIVKPLSESVTINSAVASAFSAKGSGFEMTVKAPITIAASLTSANKTINFEKGAIINGGTITLGSKVNFKDTESAGETLTVKSGTVTVSAVFDEATLLVEGGTVTLNSDVDAEVTGGKLTLNNTAYSSKITVNKADASESAEVTFTNGDSSRNTWMNYSNTAVVNKKGTVTIPSNAILNELTNSSIADNNGIIYQGTNNAKATINNLGKIAGSFTSGETTITYTYINNGTIDMKDANAEVTVNGSGSIKNNVDATKITRGSNSIYYEFNSDVNGKLVPKCSNYTMIYLNGMTWNPEASQVITADIKMTDATIAIYDQETKIGVKGKVYVENSKASKSSNIKGNSEAYFWARGKVVSVGTLSVTGIKEANVKWDWDGTGEVGAVPAPASETPAE